MGSATVSSFPRHESSRIEVRSTGTDVSQRWRCTACRCPCSEEDRRVNGPASAVVGNSGVRWRHAPQRRPRPRVGTRRGSCAGELAHMGGSTAQAIATPTGGSCPQSAGLPANRRRTGEICRVQRFERGDCAAGSDGRQQAPGDPLAARLICRRRHRVISAPRRLSRPTGSSACAALPCAGLALLRGPCRDCLRSDCSGIPGDGPGLRRRL